MRGSEPYYPVNTESLPKADDRGFVNTCVGGVTVREEVALRILQSLLSNPAYVAANGIEGKSVALAFEIGDYFVSRMGVSEAAKSLQC